MSEHAKIKPSHLSRVAIVYVRQSSAAQVEHNRESTARQYGLTQRAAALGWSADRVTVIDEDLGLSGATTHQRSGFARMTAEVALSHVGIILGLEVSRMARNNADWYRLLDLCSMTDTLIGDADGVYHPSLFNDRLLLGLKGTMSEAELHVLRARLDGGIRNKAARGELRRGLPVGFVWGEADGEILVHPDAAVSGAVRAVFDRFAEFGSARRVWLWFRSEGLSFPLQTHARTPLRWVAPTYTTIHAVLSNPVYAGAYAYGKSRTEQFVDEQGLIRKRIRMLPRSQWAVLIPGHHEGYIDWPDVRGQPAAPGHEHAPATPPAGRRVERRRRAAARPGHVRPLRTQVAHALPRPAAGAGLPLRQQERCRRSRRVLPERRRRADRRGRGQGVPHRRRSRRPERRRTCG